MHMTFAVPELFTGKSLSQEKKIIFHLQIFLLCRFVKFNIVHLYGKGDNPAGTRRQNHVAFVLQVKLGAQGF